MSANQARFPVTFMARVLGVSKAGYYAWRHRPPSARARADEALLARIKTVPIGSRQTYGAPRVHAELRAAGERHGRKRIKRRSDPRTGTPGGGSIHGDIISSHDARRWLPNTWIGSKP